MKARKTTSIVIKICTYCILLLVLAGGVGFLAFFTNGFKSDFKTFYVQYGSENIIESKQMVLPCNKELKFDCRYLFESASNQNNMGFDVKILPGGADFDFLVDGQTVSYAREKDLTSGFDLTIHDSGFVLICNRNVAKVLERVYEGYTVDVPDGMENRFKLVVTSYNGKSAVTIDFTYVINVTGVELDKGDISVWL